MTTESATSEVFDEDEFIEDLVIRGKWAMDGATTLAEAAEMLQGYAQYLLDLALEGWTLSEPVDGDYGFIVRPGAGYTTGTGQKLVNVHPADSCRGVHCVIHNPSDHSMRDFPTHWRSDRGIMERICPCGVGHPDPDSPWPPGSYEWIHGCCGHCGKAYEAEEIENAL